MTRAYSELLPVVYKYLVSGVFLGFLNALTFTFQFCYMLWINK